MKQPVSNFLLYAVFGVFISGGYWFYQQLSAVSQSGQSAMPARQAAADRSRQERSLPATKGADSIHALLGFDYNITTEVVNNDQVELASSVFSGKLVLKRVPAQNNLDTSAPEKQGAAPFIWQGQILDGQLSQAGKTKQFDQAILFTAQYQEFVFNDINFLGLDAGHPANAVRYLLKQVSYDLKQPITIATATDIARYRYLQRDNRLNRELESREILHDTQPQALNISVEKVTEDWQLILDNNALPEALNNSLTTFYQSQDGGFAVKQRLTVTALDTTALEKINNGQEGSYNANANSSLVYQAPGLNVQADINSYEALMQALAKLATLPDEALAKSIGKYLIEHYSADELVKLMKMQENFGAENNDKLASLIIYSIQKNPEFAAEVTLVDLLEHPELETINKQRVIMSLGRFEAVSEHSLNRLQQLAQTSDNVLAHTAQLSIGTAARYNEQQKESVSDYLSGQLRQSDNKAVTLLAINNSGLNTLNAQAVNYLGDKSAAVNVALIKLLAKDPAYHEQLINYAIVSNQAKTIHALGRALAAKQLTLNPAQEQQISAQIDKTQTRVVKEQLLALLADEEQSW
ncbi:hypothetical protein [Thalassomonas actiniarum]|uniref:Uncharacterized protein n=1 Tax=Thalassomonas actiniarum TaxID=485447 RepID=A0AAE9YJ94_9GAMM|nr:hypothetical protein [Thalassomonas actiniarum]WDD97039.1 hypothetical protein SG35_016940 [Thalassomonas actiniarum]